MVLIRTALVHIAHALIRFIEVMERAIIVPVTRITKVEMERQKIVLIVRAIIRATEIITADIIMVDIIIIMAAVIASL